MLKSIKIAKLLLSLTPLILVSSCANQGEKELKQAEPKVESTTSKENEQPQLLEESRESQEEVVTNSETANYLQRHYTFEEKQEISDQFLQWAGERAVIAGMAVNQNYFNHGASGRGDWYAVTPKGEYILVQQQDPTIRQEEYAYLTHAIGGVVFYYSKYGTVGMTNELNNRENNPGLAIGFSQVVEPATPIVKYLLCDNGDVYEYQSNVAFSDGFYVTDDEGNFDYWPTEQLPFSESEDEAAYIELQRILAEYN